MVSAYTFLLNYGLLVQPPTYISPLRFPLFHLSSKKLFDFIVLDKEDSTKTNAEDVIKISIFLAVPTQHPAFVFCTVHHIVRTVQ